MWADLAAALPLVIVSLAGLVVVVFDAYRNRHAATPLITLAALVLAFLIEIPALSADGTAFHGMLRIGGAAAFVNLLVLGSGILSVMLAMPYLKRLDMHIGEVYSMLLFATAGMLMLGAANHLVTVFVGLETMSVCLYILTGLVRRNHGAIESALKYFLLGAFSTGFFLYGMALLYGATGTMSLPEMQAAAGSGSVMFWAGVALLLVGFLFKVSAVPFHMWTPDVYQGAPTPIVGFMSTASKAAAFSALITVLVLALPPERWTGVLAVFAVITMVIGNVLALSQSNVKRMLAYSSIAHAGYILVALAAGTPEGYSGALFYLLVYTVMNIGAFGVLSQLEWDDAQGSTQSLDSLAGVGYRRPLLGWTMVFFMFSLAGFPPLAGFLGKWAVFAPAIDAGLLWLAIAGVLASAMSAYYYLRVLVVFFMKDAREGEPGTAAGDAFVIPAMTRGVLVFCTILLVVLGVTTFAWDLTGTFFGS